MFLSFLNSNTLCRLKLFSFASVWVAVQIQLTSPRQFTWGAEWIRNSADVICTSWPPDLEAGWLLVQLQHQPSGFWCSLLPKNQPEKLLEADITTSASSKLLVRNWPYSTKTQEVLGDFRSPVSRVSGNLISVRVDFPISPFFFGGPCIEYHSRQTFEDFALELSLQNNISHSGPKVTFQQRRQVGNTEDCF